MYAAVLQGYVGTPDWTPDGVTDGPAPARPDGSPFEWFAADRVVVCAHCGAREFHERTILLDTRGASLLQMEWLGASACVLECPACGHLAWFTRRPVMR